MTDADSRPDGIAVSGSAQNDDCMNGVQLMPAANDNTPIEGTAASSPTRNPSRWTRGHSGNPRGKARGTRNTVTQAIESVLAVDAETLAQTAIALALDGDVTALKMCLDRLAPPRRFHPIRMKMPPVRTAADVSDAMSALLAAMARGSLAPEQAITVAQMLEMKRKAIETHEFETRLTKLEATPEPRALR